MGNIATDSHPTFDSAHMAASSGRFFCPQPSIPRFIVSDHPDAFPVRGGGSLKRHPAAGRTSGDGQLFLPLRPDRPMQQGIRPSYRRPRPGYRRRSVASQPARRFHGANAIKTCIDIAAQGEFALDAEPDLDNDKAAERRRPPVCWNSIKKRWPEPALFVFTPEAYAGRRLRLARL